MRFILMSAVLGALTAAAARTANAQSPPTLLVEFMPLSHPTSVPLSPWVLLFSVLAIGLVLIRGRGKDRGHWLRWPTLMVLIGIGFSQPESTQAETAQRTLDLPTLSPASITLNTERSEHILVRNTTSQILRITSLHLQNGTDTMRLLTPSDSHQVRGCSQGLVLAPQQSCAMDIVVSKHFPLQAGRIIPVKLRDLRPTQPAVGYDQIYYHLARKQPDLDRFEPGSTNYTRQTERTELKRAQDYCADTGRGTATDYMARNVSLVDGRGFTCTLDDAHIDASALKTVVIGPNGQLYLTDGHHTFTTLWELNDGGPELPVFVRVVANLSDKQDLPSFWRQMQDSQYVWLRDAQGMAITPAQLPSNLGLAALADDPYRALVYLTRDMGYTNSDVPEFAEFYWGLWLREQGFDLSNYDLSDLTPAGVVVTSPNQETADTGSSTSYVAAVRDAALLMRQLTPDTEIAPGVTATQLGQNTLAMTQNDWDTLLEEEIWQDDTRASDNRYRTGGKAWYAIGYRLCGPPAGNPACWQCHMVVDH